MRQGERRAIIREDITFGSTILLRRARCRSCARNHQPKGYAFGKVYKPATEAELEMALPFLFISFGNHQSPDQLAIEDL